MQFFCFNVRVPSNMEPNYAEDLLYCSQAKRSMSKTTYKEFKIVFQSYAR